MNTRTRVFQVSVLLVLAAVTFGWVVSSQAAPKPLKDCAIPVEAEFRDLATDGVRSDGRRYYRHDVDGTVRIQCDGRFWFDGQLRFDLAASDGTALNGLVAQTNLVVEIAHIDDGLQGMSSGQSTTTTKVQANFVDESTNTRYFLAFWSEMRAGSSDIDVTRLDENTWVIEAASEADASLQSTPARKGKKTRTDHGLTKAPFKITLRRIFP